jgi:acetylornithine deacetylase/succinyl-diaminopimelate desuccinylase-like protein
VTELSHASLRDFVGVAWRDEIVPALTEYIRIPNKSPAFEPDWEKLGHMERAVALLAGWAREKIAKLPGATLDILRLPGRTPLIVVDVPGAGGDTILMYGHLDKQPEMTGWAPGKGPWQPVIEDEKLYGRGGADDGYALYGALTALLALKDQGAAHARCVILIEASEESGSPDLSAYMELLAGKLGEASLVICLDSGCGDYDRLWLTSSLRGLIGGDLRIDVLEEGVHSGDASGIVPSSFRVLRQLLGRLDDPDTGAVRLAALHVEIPAERVAQARVAAEALGDAVYAKFPFVAGMRPASEDLAELVLNRTWRPALSVTGFDGAPAPDKAGNVLRPFTAARLSMRLPPTVDANLAEAEMKRALEANPPYGARVSFESEHPGTGWNAPATAPWLLAALEQASQASWGKPMAMMGEGGTIPFMAMLGRAFPKAQFVVTGVLGPNSNAHGPNEFLHIPTGKRVTETVARVVRAHARATRS